jgi:hypothetical protein
MKYVKLNCRGSMDSKFMAESGFACSKALTAAALLRAKISDLLCSNEIIFCRCTFPVI